MCHAVLDLVSQKHLNKVATLNLNFFLFNLIGHLLATCKFKVAISKFKVAILGLFLGIVGNWAYKPIALSPSQVLQSIILIVLGLWGPI